MPRSRSKKGKSQSTPRKSRVLRPRTGPKVSSRSLGPLTAAYARSLVDPWNVSACIPDGANGVGCFSLKQVNNIGTGTGTACSIFVNPQSVVNYSLVDSGSTSATPQPPANYSKPIATAALSAVYAQARIVSAGLRVTYVGNTQTDQGVLLLGQVAAGVAPANFSGVTLAVAQSFMQDYKLIPLRSGGQVTWRPQAMVDTDDYFTTTGTVVGNTVGPGAPYLAAMVYGASPNTGSLLLCDYVTNYEGQYQEQTFLPGGMEALSKPAETGWFESARNVLRSLDPIMPYVSSTLANAFNSPVANSAMQMLLGVADKRGLPKRSLGYMEVD